MVSELVIITSCLRGKAGTKAAESAAQVLKEKKAKIESTFSKFPNVKAEITWVEKGLDGRLRPHRWEVIRDKFPDFDIYIDDNPSLVANSPSTLKYMNQIPNIKDKVFVLNDYKSNRKVTGPNIYHVKTEVSDLKNEDFEKAAQELKNKKLHQENQNPKGKNYWPWIIGGGLVGGSLIILLGFYFWNRKRKKR